MATSAPLDARPARRWPSAFRLPARGWGWVRRHPWVVLFAVLLTVAAAVVGGLRYADHQWRAAQEALRLEQPEEARKRLEVCLMVWPRSPEVHLAAARAARLALDLPAAEAHITQALRRPDVDADAAQVEMLLVRVQDGELEELTPTLLALVEEGSPQGLVILETLSRAYMHKLRYHPALGILSRWAELKPDEVKAYHWRAWVLERLNSPRGAVADYKRVLDLDPEQAPARLRLAEMLLDDKQAPEALPHLERLYRQTPHDPRVLARLGACRLLQGRLDEARSMLEPAAAQLPGDPALMVALASLEVQEGRGAEAERRLKAFLAAEPSDTEAVFVLSSAQRLQGKTAEAAETLKEYERRVKLVERTNHLLTNVVDTATATPDDFAETGQNLLNIGREKLGAYWLTRALERNPTHQAAHRGLAEHYERAGDAAQALFHRRQLRDPAAPVATPDPPRR